MKSFVRNILTAVLAISILFATPISSSAEPETDDTNASETSATASDAADDKIITLEEAPDLYLYENLADAPQVNGKAYLLFDLESSANLLGKDIDVPLEPASTTKIMTVLLAFEKCELDDIVTITPPMFSSIPDDYVKLGMTEGEEFTVEDLINAAMLKSCNDAALALAVHISGTEAEFCSLMNERAKELGCTNTNFTTSYGLADPRNTISVSDMCKIMKQIITFPQFTEIATSSQYEIGSTNKYSDNRVILNANRFISTQQFAYDAYLGGKTGFTESAGNTIVAAAKKNDRTLIGVIFGAEDSEMRYRDLINMFDYGFSKYTTVLIDSNDYNSIYKDTQNQIKQLLIQTDLEISKYELDLSEYHTTLSNRALTGYTAVAELSDVVIDPGMTCQEFKIPLYRRYNDGMTYEVGTIDLEVSSKERLIEITPEKRSNNLWSKFKNVTVTVLIISALAIILIVAMFIFRRKNIRRRDDDFRNRSKML